MELVNGFWCGFWTLFKAHLAHPEGGREGKRTYLGLSFSAASVIYHMDNLSIVSSGIPRQ